MDVTKLKKSPKCPYCGNVMKLNFVDNRPTVPRDNPNYWECAKDWQYVAYYTCTHCSQRTGTTIKAPQAHGSDPKEVMIAAYVEAIPGALQKPLTWEEIPDHKLIFMELRGIDKPIPSILRQTIDDQAFYTMESGCVFTFAMDELGKRWRPWATEPTEEERSAQKWIG